MALTKIDDRGLKTPIDLLDNEKIRLGTGNDLQIYHSGSHAYLTNSTGFLIVGTNIFRVLNADHSEYLLQATENGAVELYYDGSKKFETSSYGVWLGDNSRVTLGGSAGSPDCHFYHDATNTNIQNITGDLIIKSNSEGDKAIVVKNGAGTELYYDNSKKLSTVANGVHLIGNAYHLDNEKSIYGGGDDLQIYHDGSHNKIECSNGQLHIKSSQVDFINAAGSEYILRSSENGAVSLYYDNSKKFETTSEGITVTGDVKSNNLSGNNLFINGAMICSQRGTSFSFAHDGTTAGYTIDRLYCNTTSLDEFDGTISQDSTVPDGEGFSKSLKLLTGTAESGVGSGERLEIWQKLEGQDLQHLAYGSSAAKKVTLSFWVRSSITGTFGFSIYKNESAGDRIVNKPYTISAANTWEKKTCTIDGDTVRAITNDTGERARLVWFLLSGSDFTSGSAQSSWNGYTTNTFAAGHAQNGVATTAGATWYITGIQLEIGSIATEFDHKSYGEELARCQRYFYRNSGNKIVLFNSYNSATDNFWAEMYLPTTMRAAPTTTVTSLGAGSINSTGMSIDQLSFQSTSGGTHFNNGTIIEASAEL